MDKNSITAAARSAHIINSRLHTAFAQWAEQQQAAAQADCKQHRAAAQAAQQKAAKARKAENAAKARKAAAAEYAAAEQAGKTANAFFLQAATAREKARAEEKAARYAEKRERRCSVLRAFAKYCLSRARIAISARAAHIRTAAEKAENGNVKSAEIERSANTYAYLEQRANDCRIAQYHLNDYGAIVNRTADYLNDANELLSVAKTAAIAACVQCGAAQRIAVKTVLRKHKAQYPNSSENGQNYDAINVKAQYKAFVLNPAVWSIEQRACINAAIYHAIGTIAQIARAGKNNARAAENTAIRLDADGVQISTAAVKNSNSTAELNAEQRAQIERAAARTSYDDTLVMEIVQRVIIDGESKKGAARNLDISYGKMQRAYAATIKQLQAEKTDTRSRNANAIERAEQRTAEQRAAWAAFVAAGSSTAEQAAQNRAQAEQQQAAEQAARQAAAAAERAAFAAEQHAAAAAEYNTLFTGALLLGGCCEAHLYYIGKQQKTARAAAQHAAQAARQAAAAQNAAAAAQHAAAAEQAAQAAQQAAQNAAQAARSARKTARTIYRTAKK